MHIELEIHHRAKARVVKRMDALDDDDVVWLQIFAWHVCAAMVRIIVALLETRLPSSRFCTSSSS